MWETAAKRSMRFWVFGHSLFEKALAPYPGMTGKALLLPVVAKAWQDSPETAIEALDQALARRIADEEHLRSPRQLPPLPLAGVPG